MKITFSSDISFQNFVEDLDLRYPSNMTEQDPAEGTVVFTGARPNSQVIYLAKNFGGEIEEDD